MRFTTFGGSRSRHGAPALAAMFFVVAACSSGDSGNEGQSATGAAGVAGAGGEQTSVCGGAASTLAGPGLVEHAASGSVTLALNALSPAPATVGNSAWSVALTGSDAKPLEGATVSVLPYMPEHHHASSITPTVHEAGGGVYEVSNIYLFMPGVWQVTFSVTSGGQTDKVQVSFCVTG